jgi:hypothetical protein
MLKKAGFELFRASTSGRVLKATLVEKLVGKWLTEYLDVILSMLNLGDCIIT